MASGGRLLLSFGGAQGASTKKAYASSNPILFPYVIRSITTLFHPGHAGLVQVSYFIGSTNSVSTDTQPEGQPVLSGLGNLDYLVDTEPVTIIMELDVRTAPTYLKMYINNTSADIQPSTYGLITIEAL